MFLLWMILNFCKCSYTGLTFPWPSKILVSLYDGVNAESKVQISCQVEQHWLMRINICEVGSLDKLSLYLIESLPIHVLFFNFPLSLLCYEP